MVPMADVIDVAFRMLVAKYDAPDVFWTLWTLSLNPSFAHFANEGFHFITDSNMPTK